MYKPLEERNTFGSISVLYDKARIGYPEAVIDDIILFAGIKKNDHILDVGCGTGKLTIPFTERGFQIVGLDISEDMIHFAQKKCSPFLNASFKINSFEEAQFPNETFELIVSGMAWHWVTPERRYEKVHRLLKTGGALALCWSHQEMEKLPFLQAVHTIFNKYGRKEQAPSGQRVPLLAAAAFEELSKNILFQAVQRKEYSKQIEFTRNGYVDLVMTYGWVQMLAPEQRNSLKNDLQMLSASYPEPLPIPFKYITILANNKKNAAVPQKLNK